MLLLANSSSNLDCAHREMTCLGLKFVDVDNVSWSLTCLQNGFRHSLVKSVDESICFLRYVCPVDSLVGALFHVLPRLQFSHLWGMPRAKSNATVSPPCA